MKRIISVLLAALTLLLMAACGQQASGSEAQSVVEPKASQMKSICELATMECYYHNVAKYKEENAEGVLWWKKDKVFWIEYSGVVKIGIDASLVNIVIDADSVSITLPEATVLSCRVDSSSLTKTPILLQKTLPPSPLRMKYIHSARRRNSWKTAPPTIAHFSPKRSRERRSCLKTILPTSGMPSVKNIQYTGFI